MPEKTVDLVTDSGDVEKVIIVERGAKPAKPPFRDRLRARAVNLFRADDGSVIWLVKTTIAWIREIVVAVNALITQRRVLRKMARDEEPETEVFQ